jgi:hypothetical protein
MPSIIYTIYILKILNSIGYIISNCTMVSLVTYSTNSIASQIRRLVLSDRASELKPSLKKNKGTVNVILILILISNTNTSHKSKRTR